MIMMGLILGSPKKSHSQSQPDTNYAASLSSIWDKHVDPDPEYFFKLYLALLLQYETLCSVLGVNQDGLDEDGTFGRLRKLARDVRGFLKSLIEASNDWMVVKKMCRDCGARHRSYGRRRFQIEYWDLFFMTMFDIMENADSGVSTSELLIWQNFLRDVIRELKIGFASAHNSAVEETDL